LIPKCVKREIITLFIIIIVIIFYEIILLFSCNFKSQFNIKSENILLLYYIIKKDQFVSIHV